MFEENGRKSQFGRDELSLIELAFTPVGTRDSRKEIYTHWQGTDADGRRKHFFKEVTAGKYGLPGYMAEEVLIALLCVASRDGFSDSTVRTNPSELLKIMGRSRSGKDYENLQDALDQLTSVYIKTNALWDTETRSYVESGFHIINQYKIATDPRSKKKQLTVTWNKDLFRIFRRQRFKPIDVGFYYSLGRATSKRLYRWLDKHLRQSGHAEIDVLHLAHVKLEMSPNKKYVSQVMQTLEPACDELKERGYCDWSKEESTTDSGWKLVFERTWQPERSSQRSEQADRLEQELKQRGITENVAQKLIRENAPDVIARQIRHYDFLRSRGQSPRSAGWLREAIEKNFGLPDELTRKLEKENKGDPSKQTRQQKEREKAAREEQQRYEEAIDAMSEQELEEVRAEAIERLDGFNRELYESSAGEALGPKALIEQNMKEIVLSETDEL